MTQILQQFFKKNPITGDALKILTHFKMFKEKASFLQESQWWTKHQLEEYQLDQLHKLLDHAYTNVPFYTKMFNDIGVKPKEIQDVKDLQKLPYVTKQVVKEHWNAFIAKNYPFKRLEYITTGGSTGQPLGLYVEKGVGEAIYMAYYQTILSRVNCHYTNKQIHFFGYDDLWNYQAFGRVLTLSTFFMTDKNLSLYVQKIKKFKPKFIIGFPSAFSMLANYMLKNNIHSFPSIKAIIPSGETIIDSQFDLFKRAFQCKLICSYGHNELSVMAGTCEDSRFYHLFPEYGITEIINEKGTPVSNDGDVGEIVATGFCNDVFPLIRYKTEDICVCAKENCTCGRNYPLVKNIIGRVQQFIVTKSNRRIPLTGIYGLVAHCTQNVKECQIYQEKPGEIQLNIVKETKFTNEDEKRIVKSFERKFQGELIMSIFYVDKIPRTTSGKHQFLIQKLPVGYSE